MQHQRSQRPNTTQPPVQIASAPKTSTPNPVPHHQHNPQPIPQARHEENSRTTPSPPSPTPHHTQTPLPPSPQHTPQRHTTKPPPSTGQTPPPYSPYPSIQSPHVQPLPNAPTPQTSLPPLDVLGRWASACTFPSLHLTAVALRAGFLPEIRFSGLWVWVWEPGRVGKGGGWEMEGDGICRSLGKGGWSAFVR